MLSSCSLLFCLLCLFSLLLFFFNDTATPEISTLSLHDALPISAARRVQLHRPERQSALRCRQPRAWRHRAGVRVGRPRSEEHTSELQSRQYLVCRLLLEKKNTKANKLSHERRTRDATRGTYLLH